MKKRIIILSIVIIIIALGTFAIWKISINNKEKEACRLYGTDYCEKNGNHGAYYDTSSILAPTVPMLTPEDYKKCPICHSGEITFEAMCDKCGHKLHRCIRCGKKL
ncbi:MAG: hypothetical protein IKE01_04785 [Clostridia bacterium]|nr:hypothetical protein [Clostridia bacterium]